MPGWFTNLAQWPVSRLAAWQLTKVAITIQTARCQLQRSESVGLYIFQTPLWFLYVAMLGTLAKRIALKLLNIAYKIQHILYSVIFFVTLCHSLVLCFIQQTCAWRLCSFSIFCALYRKGSPPPNSLVEASPLPWTVPDYPPYKPSHCAFPGILLPLVFTSSHLTQG